MCSARYSHLQSTGAEFIQLPLGALACVYLNGGRDYFIKHVLPEKIPPSHFTQRLTQIDRMHVQPRRTAPDSRGGPGADSVCPGHSRVLCVTVKSFTLNVLVLYDHTLTWPEALVSAPQPEFLPAMLGIAVPSTFQLTSL